MPKLLFGEPAPFFQAPAYANPRYNFDTVAGRPVLLIFVGTPAGAAARRLVAEVKALRPAFDDHNLALFYVVSDPAQFAELGIDLDLPGIRYFRDDDRRIATLFGFTPATADGDAADQQGPVETAIVLLDRALRCLESTVVGDSDTRPLIGQLIDSTRALSAWQRTASINHAPVLPVERVFEPGFCRTLIDYFDARGGEETGFIAQQDERTVGLLDRTFKRRRDCEILDKQLRDAAIVRLDRRLVPMIRRAYQYEPTRGKAAVRRALGSAVSLWREGCQAAGTQRALPGQDQHQQRSRQACGIIMQPGKSPAGHLTARACLH